MCCVCVRHRFLAGISEYSTLGMCRNLRFLEGIFHQYSTIRRALVRSCVFLYKPSWSDKIRKSVTDNWILEIYTSYEETQLYIILTDEGNFQLGLLQKQNYHILSPNTRDLSPLRTLCSCCKIYTCVSAIHVLTLGLKICLSQQTVAKYPLKQSRFDKS